ncbi:MAG TPA: hypothetical protein VF516_04265 [Kofleriaceae bacterium]
MQLAEIDFRQKRSPAESLDRAQDAIDSGALRADPEDASAYTTKSYVLLRRFRIPSLTGQGDQRPLLEQIAQAAARAVELDPQDAHTWIALGNAHIYRGPYETGHGGNGEVWLNQALDEFAKALAIEPSNVRAHNDLGIAHRWLATAFDKAGKDPLPEYKEALHSYERAADIDPRYLPACTNQVDLYVAIADHDNAIGVDPRTAVDSAQRVGARCLAIDRNFYKLHDTLAQAELALARYLVETENNPMTALTAAREALDRAEAGQHDLSLLSFHRLVAANTEARFLLRSGTNPTSTIAAGRAALTKTTGLMPLTARLLVEAAHLDLAEARWAAHERQPPMPALEKARDEAEQAVTRDPGLASAYCTAAEVYLELATAQPSRASRERGIQLIDKALQLNSRLSEAKAIRAALQQLPIP